MDAEIHKCPACGKDVPDERRDLLGIETCVGCTKQKPKPRGAMVYDHKTAGTLAVCETDGRWPRLAGTALI